MSQITFEKKQSELTICDAREDIVNWGPLWIFYTALSGVS